MGLWGIGFKPLSMKKLIFMRLKKKLTVIFEKDKTNGTIKQNTQKALSLVKILLATGNLDAAEENLKLIETSIDDDNKLKPGDPNKQLSDADYKSHKCETWILFGWIFVIRMVQGGAVGRIYNKKKGK